MFEIDELKEMKLLELQEIAQKIDVPKFRQLKKLDLVYQILDVQAANPKQVKESAAAVSKTKTKKNFKKRDRHLKRPLWPPMFKKQRFQKNKASKKEPKAVSPRAN